MESGRDAAYTVLWTCSQGKITIAAAVVVTINTAALGRCHM